MLLFEILLNDVMPSKYKCTVFEVQVVCDDIIAMYLPVLQDVSSPNERLMLKSKVTTNYSYCNFDYRY